jgi:hypothetical protein
MKGILFKQPMIQAIVEGRKTVTRRIIKPQPPIDSLGNIRGGEFSVCGRDYTARYQVDDVVYIKEAWMETPSGKVLTRSEFEDKLKMVEVYALPEIHWHSPMFLKAIHARYFIKIKDVRPERLQEIDSEIDEAAHDTIKEGCPVDLIDYPTARYIWFKNLWNSINAKWKREYNKELKIYEFWQFPWCEEDAMPIPKSTEHPERYHCVPNCWVWRIEFEVNA